MPNPGAAPVVLRSSALPLQGGPPDYLPWLIGLVLVIVAGLAVYGWMREKKRREAMGALARKLGWRFTPGHDRGHDEEYAHFEIFRRGHSRSAFNTMWGSIDVSGRELSAQAGDFRYKVTSGGKNRSTRTYRFSYLIVHLPWRTPALLIRPEGLFDKLKGAVGFDDIDFESAGFSKAFYVQSDDKRFAYDVVHARMMEFLLQAKPPMIDVEFGRACLSDGGKRWSPEEFEEAIALLDRFLELWPEHVVADLEGQRA